MAKKQLRPASAAEQFVQTVNEAEREKLECMKQNEGIDKEEAENIENQAAVEEKEQAGEIEDKVTVKQPKLGQPRKYDEPTKHVSFSLPLSVIEDLRIIAGIEKTNQTQVILGLIRDKLEREADKIKMYKELFH